MSRSLCVVVGALLLTSACAPERPASGGGESLEEGQPITIGASLSLTGEYERTGENMRNGYELWLEEINSKGGLLGREVKLEILDDQSDPDTAARLYEKLITQDEVDLLMGPYSSPVTLAASTVTEKHGFPMVAAGASASEIWSRGYKNIFGLYTLAETYSYSALELAAEEGYETVAIVHEDTAFTIDAADGAERRAEELGLEVVARLDYPAEQTDFSTAMSKVKNSGAEVLIGGTYLPASVAMVRQAFDLGYEPKMMFFTVGPSLPEFPENLGPLANNVLGDSQWESVMPAVGIEEFIQKYEEEHGVPPGYHAAGAFAGGQVLAAAVEEARGIDRDKLRDAFNTLEVDTVFGPWKVDVDTGINVGKPTILIQYQDGERVPVGPPDVATHEAILPFEFGR